MIWSKLKKAAESMLADSLRGRVQYHTTRYGDGTNNLLRRGWITFEGREIASFSNFEKAQQEAKANGEENAADLGDLSEFDLPTVYGRDDLVAALEAIVSVQVDDALSSSNPLLRALAMLDRRLGKRRLSAMTMADDEHELVRMMYRLRCMVEGIRTGE